MQNEVALYGGGIKKSLKKILKGDNLKAFLTVGMLFTLYPLCGVYNISFFAVNLFQKLDLGGAEAVAVFTALVRVLGTFSSSLLLLRYFKKCFFYHITDFCERSGMKIF